MDMLIKPGLLRGALTPPPSKSLTHRALIAAYLAGEPDHVVNPAISRDTEATRRCLRALTSPGLTPEYDCGESGSTLRFLMPLSLVLRGGGRFLGSGRLMERPLGPYIDIFREHGVEITFSGGAAELRGRLTPGVYSLPGDVSSQFITGLLFALPLLSGESTIEVTTPLESREYAAMTVDILKKYGISVENEHFRRFHIPGGQKYVPRSYTVEADWSQAAFWFAANFLGGKVEIEGLSLDSLQGDRAVEALTKKLYTPGDAEVDVSQIPDLLPPLAVMAAARGSTTLFTNAARLRMKESDRIASTAAMLRAFGVDCAEHPDALMVRGGGRIRSCAVDGAGDHRIVMAAAILATAASGPVTIRGAEAVEKSYPRFFEDFRMLGGDAYAV